MRCYSPLQQTFVTYIYIKTDLDTINWCTRWVIFWLPIF